MEHYKKYSDLQLSQMLTDGDDLAYEEIYSRYWQAIYVIACNRLHNSESAQDLVHDTFAALWLNRGKVTIENLKSYLAIAIKYRVFEYVRREKLQFGYAQNTAGKFELNQHAIDETLHLKHILRLLQKEIENLPEKCKLVFKYSREQHKSTAEIAEELNISKSTVENQLNKALNRLRKVLKTINLFL
jgi:RNA polymerase sigma-70 factor (family 1)